MGNRVEVKFNKTYVASRGNSISGAKGEVKFFPESDDLDELIKKKVLEQIKVHKPGKKKRTPAAGREKAMANTGEQS